VAFDQDPAVTTVLPTMRDPYRAFMRRVGPVAVDPDVAVAVPAVIAVDPNPSAVRRTVVGFDDGIGRRYANYDLRKSGGRRETNCKQQRQCSFFHGSFPSMVNVGRAGQEEAFRAIACINTRLRNWLR